MPLFTETPKVPGLDGRKMSKSYGNAIFLSDPPATVASKIDAMLTDPQRTHRHIPGNPEICPVFHTHKVFSSPETIAWSAEGCRTAGIGCRDCKRALKESVEASLQPIRERRRALEEDPSRVDAILEEGAMRARETARPTMRRVRGAMGLQP